MDPEKIRKDFPIFSNQNLIYLDSAATSQKPNQVLEKVDYFYKNHNANVHRGVYKISEDATEDYESARSKIAGFIGSKNTELIFTRNATEGFNLIAYTWAEKNIKKGDKIVLSIMEHHSNFVPWQQLAIRKKAKLEFLNVDSSGSIPDSEFSKIEGSKIVSIVHVSNMLGTINPVKKICSIAKDENAISIVDGAQSAPHMPVDVRDIGCDFFVFTGHKMLGPNGIGALYGSEGILEEMPPFNYGGDMIREVHKEKSEWNVLPYKFEAGTPNASGAVGLGAAVDYLNSIGMENVSKHDSELTKFAMNELSSIDSLDLYGPKDISKRGSLVSFNLKGVHPHDVAALLNEDGIAIRSGHHCTMPLHEYLNLTASNRASFYIYNTKEEISKLIESLNHVKKLFKVN